MEGQTVISPENNLLTVVKKAYKYYNLSLLSLIIYKLLVYAICYVNSISQGAIAVLNGIAFSILIWFLVSVYKLASLLKQNTKDKTHPALWVVLMIIPLFGIIGILIIYNKARKLIKELES
ncbi:MAG: hypothetical protein NTX01_07095 [Candidatus Omnitrophica bacterium]|nr:hypothetical protein [Candidatus Omnitrophota bacterium]